MGARVLVVGFGEGWVECKKSIIKNFLGELAFYMEFEKMWGESAS